LSVLDRLALPELPTFAGERVILRGPSRLRYHLMFTVRPRSGPEQNHPSIPGAAADGSSSMPKICAAIHSPRCPDVIGRPVMAAMS
jgi:hypothetical protein